MELLPKVFGLNLGRVVRGTVGLALLAQVGSAWAGTVVQFRTELGDFEVELYDTAKPATTENFLRNVTAGAYASTYFHDLKPGVVANGGKFRISANGDTNLPPIRPAVTNEFNVGPVLPNVAGTLAMVADSADPNSATVKFALNLKDNPQFDSPTNSGGAVVFGRVITGSEVLTKLNAFKPALGLPANQYFKQTNCILNIPPVLESFPIYGFTFNSDGTYTARGIALDITLLRVRVSQDGDGLTRVRWNPVYGRTNTVEYTDVFPPVWQKLVDVDPASIPAPVYSGSGIPAPGTSLNLPAVVVDANAAPGRFYRVRATY
jgi:peptidyl-prolyl cis-trans isomerase A (cyclophilin A)